MTSPVERVVMCELLHQFDAEHNWAILEKDIKDNGALDSAKFSGFIEYWKPPKGSTYYSTLLCTLKGRLYMRKNTTTGIRLWAKQRTILSFTM